LVELHVLGALDLQGPGAEDARAILSQPKRATLLVYLAVARPRGFHTREKLLGLFWPEQDQEHARSALRSSLYFLRGSLNEDLLRSRGAEDVGLDHERIWCDAVAFEEAVEGEDPEEALRLYRGHLLEGVFLSDCPEFERWLDEERERLREMAAGSAWALAHRHIQGGHFVEAERAGQRALSLVGTDESAVREFIAALAAVGDRAGAVRFYEKFAAGLKRNLNLEPSAHSQELVAQIRASAGPAVPATVSATRLTRRTAEGVGFPRDRRLAETASDSVPVPWQARPKVSWTFAGIFAVLAVVALWILFHPPPQPNRSMRVDLVAPDGRPLYSPALSPDGSLIVARAAYPDPMLWIRRVADSEAEPIQGTSRARFFNFSPDGDRIVYNDFDPVTGRAEVFVAPVRGGVPTRLIPAARIPEDSETAIVGGGLRPDWGDDGMIYFQHGDSICRVQAEGGSPNPFTTVTDPNERHLHPDVLPDGRGLIFTVLLVDPGEIQDLWVATVGPEGGKPSRLFRGFQPLYAPSGHLLYATADGQLAAVAFDPERREPTGLHQIVEPRLNISIGGWFIDASFSVSGDGTLLYRTGPPPAIPHFRLILSTPLGEERVDPTWVRPFERESPKLSPDGRRYAVVSREEGRKEIWIGELDGNHWELTAGWGESRAQTNVGPSWTPDGKYVTFLSDRNGQMDVWKRRADRLESAELVLDRERAISEAFWSPHGWYLVYATDPSEDGSGDILAIRADSGYSIPPDDEPIPLAVSGAREWKPALSPDGRWLAYLSNESGFDRLSIVPFPEPGEVRVSLNADQVTHFAWAPDGREIFFRVSNFGQRAVTVETTPTLSLGDVREESDWEIGADMGPGGVSLRLERVVRGSGQPDPGWVVLHNFFQKLTEEG
jgi:serine/threonine-protein kinase